MITLILYIAAGISVLNSIEQSDPSLICRVDVCSMLMRTDVASGGLDVIVQGVAMLLYTVWILVIAVQ